MWGGGEGENRYMTGLKQFEICVRGGGGGGGKVMAVRSLITVIPQQVDPPKSK